MFENHTIMTDTELIVLQAVIAELEDERADVTFHFTSGHRGDQKMDTLMLVRNHHTPMGMMMFCDRIDLDELRDGPHDIRTMLLRIID